MSPQPFDYADMVIDAMVHKPEIYTAIATSHCTNCLVTYTAISHSPRTATILMKRKFRNHKRNGSCVEKADWLAQQISEQRAKHLLSQREGKAG